MTLCLQLDRERANRLIRIIRDDLGAKQAKIRQEYKNEFLTDNVQNRAKVKELFESQLKEISLAYLDAYLTSLEKTNQLV